MSIRMLAFGGLVSLTLSFCQGCKIGPYHQQPGAEIQEAYRHTEESDLLQGGEALAQWWYQFEDPTLDALMSEAVAQNLDLEVAALRVMESRYQRGVVRADLFPQIDSDGSYTFQKTAISGGIFGQLGGFAIDSTIDNWDMGFNASWELDVFGRLRRNVEASEADICVNVWDYRDAMIILMADVATNYVDARTFQKRLAIAYENLESQRQTLEIIGVRQEEGVEAGLAVVQAETNVYNTESTIPTLEIGYQQAVNRLSVLLGRPPGYVDEMMSVFAEIPSAKQEVAVGIPADLLRRRPDIRRAERQLAAQTARIGVAIGDLYPQFGINGTFGVNSQDFSELYNTNSIASTIGPSVRWNILNFGRIRCNIRVQEARADQFLLQYQNTVLGAAEEVDNSLIAYAREKSRVSSLTNAVSSASDAVSLSEIANKEGTSTFLSVLDAQRSLLQFEDQLAVSRSNVARNLIQLYRALGGGWEWVEGDCLNGLYMPGLTANDQFVPTQLGPVGDANYDNAVGEPAYYDGEIYIQGEDGMSQPVGPQHPTSSSGRINDLPLASPQANDAPANLSPAPIVFQSHEVPIDHTQAIPQQRTGPFVSVQSQLAPTPQPQHAENSEVEQFVDRNNVYRPRIAGARQFDLGRNPGDGSH